MNNMLKIADIECGGVNMRETLEENRFITVLSFTALFIALHYSFNDLKNFTRIEPGIESEFLAGELSFDQFVSDYLLPIIFILFEAVLFTFLVIAFNWLINSFVVSRLTKEKASEKISIWRRFIALLCRVEMIHVYRIVLVYSMIFLYSSNEMKIYSMLWLVFYLFLTYWMKSSSWVVHNRRKSWMINSVALGVPLVAAFFTVIIGSQYAHLEWSYYYSLFMILLLIIEFGALILFMAVALLTSDFEHAKLGKQEIISTNDGHYEQRLGNYITSRNHRNLSVSIYLFIVFVLFILGSSGYNFVFRPSGDLDEQIILKSGLWSFVLLALARLLSRSIEIVHSFVKDITSKSEKSSNLDGKDRMLLAIKSLGEITFLATIIRGSYTLVQAVIEYEIDMNDMMNSKFIVELISNSFFVSIATAGFNISFDTKEDFVEKIVHITQLIVSVSLITLSIATYISFIPKKSEE